MKNKKHQAEISFTMNLQGSWCLPRPSASSRELLDNINYACNVVSCTSIQQGGPCFHPNSLINHASFVMNLYYQKSGRHFWNCDFKNTAVIVVTDPSKENLKYLYCIDFFFFHLFS